MTHVIVGGLIENAATAQVLPDLYAGNGDGEIVWPHDLAQVYWQLHIPHASAWIFEQGVRPFAEPRKSFKGYVDDQNR